MFCHLWQFIAWKPLHDIAAKIAHVFVHMLVCSHVKASLAPTLQKFCNMSSSWLMTDGIWRLTNLSAALTLISLSFWNRALTCSALSTIHEVVRWHEWSSSRVLVLLPQYPSTHWCTFLCIMQFFPYYANILLWILKGFSLSDHKTEW